MLRNNNRRLLPVLLLPLLLAVPSTADAQGTYSVAGYSLAGARGTAFSDIDAALVNPAILGLPWHRSFSMRLFSTSAHVDQNLMSVGRYNRWVGQFLDEEEIDNYLESLGDAARIRALVEVGTFGMQFGRLAFGLYHVVDVEARFPSDLLRLVLKGNELNETFHFGEIGASTEVVSVWHASYAFKFPASIDTFFKQLPIPIQEIYGGIGIKYYMGHVYADVEDGTIDLTFLDDGMYGVANYPIRSAGVPWESVDLDADEAFVINDDDFGATAGGGFGIDLGVAAVIDSHLSAHVALLNLSPGIRWGKASYDVQFTATADSISFAHLAFPDLEGEAETTDFDSLTSYDAVLEDLGSFYTPVPVIFRVGGSYRTKRLALNAEFEQAFSRGLGYSTIPRLAFGFEYRPVGVLPLRAGMSFGGRHGMVGAIGFGLDFRAVVFELGVANTGLTPGGVKGIGVAVGLKMSF